MIVKMNAREIMNLAEDELWAIDAIYPVNQKVVLVFDDDGVDIPEATTSGIIVSYYFWQMLKLYPKAKLLSDYYVGNFKFSGSLATTILTKIVGGIREVYGGEIDYRDTLAKQIYENINRFYNVVVTRMSEYVETTYAKDYVEVIDNPEIVELREELYKDPTPNKINGFYDKLRNVMNRKDFLKGNALVETMRGGLRSIGQIQQCVGVRGAVTDMDSTVFKIPVLESFGEGLKRMSNFMKETRSATKSLMFQSGPIKDTEYFNRRMQLFAETVRHLFKGDCGTHERLPWRVEPGDIKALDGRFYTDENGVERVIHASDPESRKLVGTTIMLRSPTMCAYSRYGGVCEHCFGETAATTPDNTNIGHLMAYKLGQSVSQNVLSTKHLDTSAVIKSLKLDKDDLRYIKLHPERNELIFFNEKSARLAKEADFKILLMMESVYNLSQAMQVKDIKKLSIYKISKLMVLGVRYTIDDMEMTDWVTVSGPSRPSSLTIPFLEYIRKTGYTQNDPKYIEVSMKDWDFSLPVLRLPQKQINMLDFMNATSSMIESGGKKSIKRGLDPSNPDDMALYLRQLFDFVSEYINVPLLNFEILALATTVNNIEDHDLRLPLDVRRRDFSSADGVNMYRSIGSAFVFQKQAIAAQYPGYYDLRYKVAHPMDNLFVKNGDHPFFDKWEKIYPPPEPHEEKTK